MAVLLAKIHKLPTDWFDEWRQKLCQTFPVLREASNGHHVWWLTKKLEVKIPGTSFGYWNDAKIKRWLKEYPVP